MTVLSRQGCESCGRTFYERGVHHTIEAALDREGAAKADEYLGQLERSKKDKDQEQLAETLIRFEDYCHRGTLRVPVELNFLQDDIWEIKAHQTRWPFFLVQSCHSGTIRLTHGFRKTADWAGRKQIDRALGIRREDGKR